MWLVVSRPKSFVEKTFSKDYNSSPGGSPWADKNHVGCSIQSALSVLVPSGGLSYFILSIHPSERATMRKDFESPIYRKSRLAARLILKARSRRPLSPRQRRVAASLAKDADVTPRLIQQGINQLCRKS
jgi:hypothetical protein